MRKHIKGRMVSMYQLTIKQSYYEMNFIFKSFEEASIFLESAMTADAEREYRFELKKVVK